jgi:hypothetical protein
LISYFLFQFWFDHSSLLIPYFCFVLCQAAVVGGAPQGEFYDIFLLSFDV